MSIFPYLRPYILYFVSIKKIISSCQMHQWYVQFLVDLECGLGSRYLSLGLCSIIQLCIYDFKFHSILFLWIMLNCQMRCFKFEASNKKFLRATPTTLYTTCSQWRLVKKTCSTSLKNKGCVTPWPCHLHFKKHLKAKEEELWKLKYFTMQKI
jgi:hypothetical protein